MDDSEHAGLLERLSSVQQNQVSYSNIVFYVNILLTQIDQFLRHTWYNVRTLIFLGFK